MAAAFSDIPEKNTRYWAALYAVFLALMLLSGGISQPSQSMVYVHTIAGSVMLVLSLLRLATRGFPSGLAKMGSCLAAAGLGLVLAQLIPLPFSLWNYLPDHLLALKNLELLGQTPGAMPLSLTPEHTSAIAISILPPLAGFFGALTISPRQFMMCGLVVIACTTIGVIFSLLQIAQGANSIFYLYEPEPTLGIGTFNNRNFFAAQVYTAIIFVGIVFAQLRQNRSGRLISETLFAVVLVGILLAGLALTGSRSGILFAMVAIPAGLVVAQIRPADGTGLRRSSAVIVATLVGIFIVAQSSMLGLLRLATNDVVEKSRLLIFERSLPVLAHTFPTGSGFGSFVPMYQLFETPRMITPYIVNHAHNDWLEIAIEGGLPSILLEAAFLILILFLFLKIWRPSDAGQLMPFQRGCVVAALLLMAHSLVDYPLRTPAMMTFFAFCCAVILVPASLGSRNANKRKIKSGAKVQEAFRGTPDSFKPNIH